jgi:hypothetical protein
VHNDLEYWQTLPFPHEKVNEKFLLFSKGLSALAGPTSCSKKASESRRRLFPAVNSAGHLHTRLSTD